MSNEVLDFIESDDHSNDSPVLKGVPCKVVLAIGRKRMRENVIYTSKISSEVGTTQAHTTTVVGELVEAGLVEKGVSQGRTIPLRLTEKGEEYFDRIKSILEV